MNTTRYTRQQIIRLLDVEESFLIALEEEQVIIARSDPGGPFYTPEACERIRIARELVHELDVNLAGAAIIIRMREQMTALRKQFHATLDLIRNAAVVAERRRGGR